MLAIALKPEFSKSDFIVIIDCIDGNFDTVIVESFCHFMRYENGK